MQSTANHAAAASRLSENQPMRRVLKMPENSSIAVLIPP